MRKLLLLLAINFIATFLLVHAQDQNQTPLIKFEKEIHEFGEIKEDGGNATYVFSFVNNSKEAIKLVGVQASCGCTTPEWTKEAILPGKQGSVTAIYNPLNRPGEFQKTITVRSQPASSVDKAKEEATPAPGGAPATTEPPKDLQITVLTIKGKVIPKPAATPTPEPASPK